MKQNKNLVVGVVGDSSMHKSWIEGKNREFDLYLIYFDDMENKFKKDCEYYLQKKGVKYPLLHQLIQEDETFFQYDAVMIPDDDLIMHTRDINRFFKLFHMYELHIAQPSIMGWYSWYNTLHHAGYLLRYSNIVEIMVPCFSKYAFKICWESFNANVSSWGIDSYWSKLINYPPRKIAVIDNVIALHTREVMSGGIYKAHDANPIKERYDLLKKHNLPYRMEIDWENSIRVDLRNKEDIGSRHQFYPPMPEVKTMLWKYHKPKNMLL